MCVRDRETHKHILERERARGGGRGGRESVCVQFDADDDVMKDIQMMKGGEREKVSEGSRDRVWE